MNLWRMSTSTTEVRTPVLWRGEPVRTGDGEGKVQGTGKFRAYLQASVGDMERRMEFGPYVKWGGYIEPLRKQGWRRFEVGFQVLRLVLFITVRITDEDTHWDPEWMAWRK